MTSFEFQLHRIGPLVQAGMLAWPMGDAAKVLQFLRDFTATAPDEVGLMANLRLAPPLPVVPEELTARRSWRWSRPTPVRSTTARRRWRHWTSSPASRRHGRRQAVRGAPEAVQSAVPHGWHYYWRSHKLGH